VAQFEKVTPEEVQKTAQEYLRPTNRTIVTLEPAPKTAAEAPAKNQ
jgi:predicted Zn-dependent peptidase